MYKISILHTISCKHFCCHCPFYAAFRANTVCLLHGVRCTTLYKIFNFCANISVAIVRFTQRSVQTLFVFYTAFGAQLCATFSFYTPFRANIFVATVRSARRSVQSLFVFYTAFGAPLCSTFPFYTPFRANISVATVRSTRRSVQTLFVFYTVFGAQLFAKHLFSVQTHLWPLSVLRGVPC